jgi:hypothetical protein
LTVLGDDIVRDAVVDEEGEEGGEKRRMEERVRVV